MSEVKKSALGRHWSNLVVLVLLLHTGSAGASTWFKNYDVGIYPSAYLQSGVATADDGFIGILGIGGGNSEISWVLKLNADGEIEWSREFENARMSQIIQTSDNGYLVGGSVFRSFGDCRAGRDGFLMKLKVTGAIEWQKFYGLEPVLVSPPNTCAQNNENLISVAETPDGGFVAAGYIDVTDFALTCQFHRDIYMLKVNGNGGVVWQKLIGTPGRDEWIVDPEGLALASGGDIAMLARDEEVCTGNNERIMLARLDSSGSFVWQRRIGGSNSLLGDYPRAIIATSDGGFAVAAETYSFGPNAISQGNIWVVKSSAIGAIEWERVYGTRSADGPFSIRETADGHLVVGGFAADAGNTHFGLVMKLDTSAGSEGDLLWARTYAGGIVFAVDESMSGDLLSGVRYSSGYPFEPAVIRTDETGILEPNCPPVSDPGLSVEDTAATVTLTAAVAVDDTRPMFDGDFMSSSPAQGYLDLCPAPPAPVIDVTPEPVDFGVVIVGSSGQATATVSNQGDADLDIDAVNAPSSASFDIESDGCTGFILAPGASCPLDLTFDPSSAGLFEDAFTVDSNDSVNPSYEVDLTGIGSSGDPILTVSLTGIGSGTVASNPGGIDCGSDCFEEYAPGTVVSLSAQASRGSEFAGWSGSGDCSDGSVTMNGNKACKADFALLPDDMFADGFESGDASAWSSTAP